ncbi:hypothetical protein [Achromobacter sp.]|uniref:hypothetical protein n=1 Tax=Achromobacter sp. TaxID=134375 RepID=UPI0025870462|nr:hypothetical protein [Achromobacter sp.]
MNTKTVLFSMSIIAAAVAGQVPAHAAPASAASDAKIAGINTADNRGFSLTYDDQYKPGSVVVSGVSKAAAAAGVRPGDVLAMICTQPANQGHYDEVAKIAGDKAAVQFGVGSDYLHGALPAAKWEHGQEVTIQAETLHEGAFRLKSLFPWHDAGKAVPVDAGAVVANVCAPVHTALEATEVVAPSDGRSYNGQEVFGGRVPMTYVFFRDGFPKNTKGSFLIATLPAWNVNAPTPTK